MDEINLLEDWKDYNESIIWSISDEYYKSQGLDPYKQQQVNKIPNSITASFPHAKSIANLIQANLENIASDRKIKILECGAGNGMFARYLLLALRDLELIDRVEYLVSDYARNGLEEIKKLNILEGFEENETYKFVELDILDLSSAQDLDANKVDVSNCDLIVLNYVLDALPATIVRANESSQKTKLEEMQLKLYGNLMDQGNFLNNLIKEERWQNYHEDQQSDAEKKYYDLILKELDERQTKMPYLYYTYGALQALENLFESLSDVGLIFTADMPMLMSARVPFKFYGDTVAHPLNTTLISLLVKKLNYSAIAAVDVLLARMMIYKNKAIEKQVNEAFNNEFIQGNQANRYLDIRNALDAIKSNHSLDLVKYLTEEVKKVDPYSAISYIILGNYHMMKQDFDLALKNYKIAKQLDYLEEYQLAPVIQSLELQCKQSA